MKITSLVAAALACCGLALSALGAGTSEPRITTRSGQYTTNQIVVEGTTTPNSGVTSVQYLLNGAGPFTASQPNTDNWNKWDATVNLVAGTNTFQVWAVGANLSPTNTAHYFLQVRAPIVVNTIGSGTLKPNLNGQELIVGHNYSMVALPGRGQVFAGWSGSVLSDAAALDFTMQSGESLTATFAASPFTNGLTGDYEGLFYDSDNVTEISSGYLTLALTDNGTFTGNISVDGQKESFKSQFDADGAAQFTIPRHGRTNLTVNLSLDLTGAHGLTGTIVVPGTNVASAFSSSLQGYKETNRGTNYDGYYTFYMPGAGTASAGNSYGTVKVARGATSTSLFLSDQTDAMNVGQLTTNGLLPLYVSLYGGRGSISGWLAFSTNDLTTTTVNWFKDPATRGSYTNGFSSQLPLDLCPYLKTTNSFGTSNVVVSITGGDLTNNLINLVTLNRTAAISATNTNSVTISLNLSTGIIAGSFHDPVSGAKPAIHGVVVQAARNAFGFFTAPNQLSGAVQVYAPN